MAYSLVFRIRGQYFRAISRGEKTTEFRAATEYWAVRRKNAERRLKYNRTVKAIFICGKEKMEKEISHTSMYISAQHALGRDPSIQGQKDLGDGPVFGFHIKSES